MYWHSKDFGGVMPLSLNAGEPFISQVMLEDDAAVTTIAPSGRLVGRGCVSGRRTASLFSPR